MIRLLYRALVFMALAAPLLAAAAERQTVCTVTVNSADEKEVFRRHLPESKYRFVELVEPGRSDWLASACRQAVACDILIVSGHYDGVSEFFSDRLEVNEYLPVAELERAACSASCPALFARLKEAYLFGCNTLNPEPQSGAATEIVRSLVREGHSRKEAERRLGSLVARFGDNSRDRMRRIFKGVPVIYGFSSVAPIGPLAATALTRHFARGGARDVGSGRASPRLLAAFAGYGLTSAAGLVEVDPQAEVRRDMCRLVDERSSDARRVGFVHELLRRPAAEAAMYFERIHGVVDALDERARGEPATAQALADIAADAAARARFIAFARDAGQPSARVRLIDLAHQLGWLSADERWQELALMLGELQGRTDVGPDEIDLACTLNRGHDLDGAFNRRVVPGSATDSLTHAAMRACLGSAEAHRRMLAALVSPDEADVHVARSYLRQRPIQDADELRQVAEQITRMNPSGAQVGALEVLGRHYLSDREILERLARLFAETPSWPVQAAIAGILIRADRRSIASAQLLRTLRDHRRAAPPGDDIVDALIRKLQLP